MTELSKNKMLIKVAATGISNKNNRIYIPDRMKFERPMFGVVNEDAISSNNFSEYIGCNVESYFFKSIGNIKEKISLINYQLFYLYFWIRFLNNHNGEYMFDMLRQNPKNVATFGKGCCADGVIVNVDMGGFFITGKPAFDL